MFQLLKDPDFDFMGKRRVLLALSSVVVLLSIGVLAVKGVSQGIEFTGGTELQLRFREAPDLGRIRAQLAELTGTTPTVTTIGKPANHEVYIKLGSSSAGDANSQEDTVQAAIETLRDERVREQRQQGLLDVNLADEGSLARLLSATPDIDPTRAAAVASTILAQRKEIAIFHSFDELAGIEGMTPGVRAVLEEGAFLGPFALRSQSYIGPVIGRELLKKAMLAILGSLLGMLVYIWVRFQFQWGLAAVIALSHDAVITLGLFSLLGKELSLPVVAAFLTLVGYSVNDTVVVFDRIRENIRSMGERDLPRVVNRSINQTLSRTIITTGSTWAVVVGLLIFGGEALNPFAFVLTVGILVGTYSSVAIASPIVVLWRRARAARARVRSAGPASARRSAKKVRPTAAR